MVIASNLILSLLVVVSSILNAASQSVPTTVSLSPRQTTDAAACKPACADRDALLQSCEAAEDVDCCRPTYPSAHLTCAYCLSFNSGITDTERESLHQSAQRFADNVIKDCARLGHQLSPASVTLTVTPSGASSTATSTTQTLSASGNSSATTGSGAKGNSATGYGYDLRLSAIQALTASFFVSLFATIILWPIVV
ncbi:hypothetical protein DFP72DRAFT_262541 [Ephemerocybe angulata]|uniref:Uncharacterized protein n=1 Tax=Ephemerocybe angulata TaxID=980116 RepID=A0A8H6I1E6_9AGAR|nr:hypothetical protein DFP72DRAFT_262541 [Tulosesus angulatus]